MTTSPTTGPGAALTDDDLPAYLDGLGVPGIVDAHVHFMPEPVMRKVWAVFDRAAEVYGDEWPITYREDDGARLARLASMRVLAFTSLVYAHRPGMAEWLNDWSLDFAARTPGCVPTATFFPDDDAERYVGAALQRGAHVFKLHLQVGGFDPRDPRLDAAWGAVAEAGAVALVHCGSGPVPGPFTGPGPIGEVLARHPRLRLLVAHLGTPEYEEFVSLAERHASVGLDTTMVGTDFTEARAPVPVALRPRIRELALSGAVVFGSDFPNIPYPYAHQVEALARLGLDDEALRAVLWHNGSAWLGVPGGASPAAAADR